MRWLLLTTLTVIGWSRHIAGADLFYECIDPAQNRYRFELWLYRDCTDPEGADYDNPVVIFIFRGDGTLHATQSVTLSSSGPWNPQGVDACFLQRPGTCLEEGVYRFILTLPPRTDGYYVAWARCCRNAAITNLASPLNMGITYLARIPPARRAPCNTSPRFVQRPPFFLCAGNDFYFNHEAVDADGDSLVYQIVPAYHSVNAQGQGAVNPIMGGSPVVNAQNPLGPPPYQTVTYAAGYSALQPFGTSGICQIDPVTGLLHLRAPNPGLYVVAIAVLEYRNGEFLGETRRDMQFYVAPCRPPTAPPVVAHDFGSLPHRGDTVLLEVAQNACFSVTIQDTQPPTPPATLTYTVSPNIANLQVSGTNPLLLQLCINPSCQDTGRVIPLYITGRKNELCGTTQAYDTLWIAVLAPPRRYIAGSLSPPNLPYSGSAFIVKLDSVACARFWVLATPSQPPIQVSYTASIPSANIQLATSWRGDTLVGEICYTAHCEAISEPLTIALQAIAPSVCPPVPVWRDTLRLLVELPSNPAPVPEFLSPDTLDLLPDSSVCLRMRIRDSFPVSNHTVYVRSEPPLIRSFTINPSTGSLTWESEVCFASPCEALGQTILLIAEVRDSLSCAELHRRYDTIRLHIRSRPTYPLALYTPEWSQTEPFQPIFHQTYCFTITARDTGRNGGTYALYANSNTMGISLQAGPFSQMGDSITGRVCFKVGCEAVADSVYPIFLQAANQVSCAVAPPATLDTIWIRPRNLPNNRPPVIVRDRSSPWSLTPSGDSVCYTLLVTDPDSIALLTYEGVGEVFLPDFFWGSNFGISASGTNPLQLRVCARINCYAQGLSFPVIVCVQDTTSCDPAQRWRVCDTLQIQTKLCHGVIPNVFTPNGDGINDFLFPYDLAGIAEWRLQVWDRWGRLIFSGAKNEPWNGNSSHGPASEGVYFYILELYLYSGSGPQLRFERAGSVSLLR
ncbi:MAG: gliding motility-associated C-terminal domain-containing protein [Bacteroidia bacterium]|nr:gliding motility-associated C-terminal domain-containing protein [Bacteroidia bacterium]